MRILPVLQRQGFRRGLGGSNTWLAVGIGAWGLRRLHVMSQRKTEILLREELKPGQRIVIANGRATLEQAQSRRQRITEPRLRTRKPSEGALESDPV